jgi:cell division protein FtsZ
LWRILAQRGLMDVQFPELCGVLRDAHAEALFAAADAEGESRAAVVVEKLLAHPLMDGGEALTQARAVLVGIAAGGNLTMAEVGRVMEAVNSRCGEARIFVGAAEDASLDGRLLVTVVAAGQGGALREEPEPLAPTRRRTASNPDQQGLELDTGFLEKRATPRPRSRFVAPKPDLTQDEMEKLASRQHSGAARGRKAGSKMRQGQLPLEIVSKGRFDKSEPTIRDGQDLDVPTFVRRNMVFN